MGEKIPKFRRESDLVQWCHGIVVVFQGEGNDGFKGPNPGIEVRREFFVLSNPMPPPRGHLRHSVPSWARGAPLRRHQGTWKSPGFLGWNPASSSEEGGI